MHVQAYVNTHTYTHKHMFFCFAHTHTHTKKQHHKNTHCQCTTIAWMHRKHTQTHTLVWIISRTLRDCVFCMHTCTYTQRTMHTNVTTHRLCSHNHFHAKAKYTHTHTHIKTVLFKRTITCCPCPWNPHQSSFISPCSDVCIRMCICVCVRVRACVCVCVCVMAMVHKVCLSTSIRGHPVWGTISTKAATLHVVRYELWAA